MMIKRSSRNFDKKEDRVFKAMRNAIFKLGLEVKGSDKETGTVEFVTKKSFIFFGGYQYTLVARSVSEQVTQVTLRTKDDARQSEVNELAESIFIEMDKELPINQA